MNNIKQLTIVDREPDDYAALAPWIARGELRVDFHSDARGALRCARPEASSLWMINLDLPDRSGIDLARMVSTHDGSPVFLVANHYNPDQELAALALGGAMYLCKPLQFDWIGQIQRSWPARLARLTAPTIGARNSRPARRCFASDLRRRMTNEFRRTWCIDLPIAQLC